MSIIKYLLGSALALGGISLAAQARAVNAEDIAAACGEAPANVDTHIIADVQGKAGLLSKYVGDASLSGKIDSTRQDIYSKYPDANAAHADAYLQYQVCVVIEQDSNMSTVDKVNLLRATRSDFSKPVKKNSPS